jgi:small subunit ribosomal protein S8
MYSDPIADLLTRIRNAYKAKREIVISPSSKIKESILQVLKANDYIKDYETVDDGVKKNLKITLSYPSGKPSVTSIKRISKTGRRVYKGRYELPYVLSGLGIAILSTSKGVMTASQARKQSLGGEIICQVW